MFEVNEEEAHLRAKQSARLDVELLCSKLEAYKREQDFVLIRRGKRDALRSGRFMPQVAAKQFTATATPLQQDSTRKKHIPPRRESASEPITRSGPLEQDHCYTAMSFGGRDNHATAAVVEEKMGGTGKEFRRRGSKSKDLCAEQHEATNDLLPATRTTRAVTSQSLRHSLIPRAELWSRPLLPRRHSSKNLGAQSDHSTRKLNERQVNQHVDAKEPCYGVYRPGDAARRRSLCEDARTENNRTIVSHDHFTTHALQDTLLYHSLEPYAKTPLPVLEESARTSQSLQRPELLPSDRPDWCQRSQNGNSPRLLHIFSRSQKAADDAYVGRKHIEIPVRGLSEVPDRPVVENGHLIADAVKIIKDQERLRKRHSVVAFFKNL
ncbi:hypothetical protein CERZMDRAFT_99130 [Cercospora zeae-maydis SCOH1-5]|uniref:Uncharacterized protein n=1 Tax=Cercospora zeae-maydis SCOH1-5 TaxID=717836 RepID=A0A6A6FBW0_9PEZI|nr:hypothetical protein CERZMDRAFT_99130 [Cercospora zeae-maydis SCOH1-5]